MNIIKSSTNSNKKRTLINSNTPYVSISNTASFSTKKADENLNIKSYQVKKYSENRDYLFLYSPEGENTHPAGSPRLNQYAKKTFQSKLSNYDYLIKTP